MRDNNKKRTHMQAFHRANRTTTLDRLVNLFIERLPVVEWFDAEKLDEGIEFFDVILPDGRWILSQVESVERTYKGVPVRHHRYLPSKVQHAWADFVFRFLMLCASSSTIRHHFILNNASLFLPVAAFFLLSNVRPKWSASESEPDPDTLLESLPFLGLDSSFGWNAAYSDAVIA
jgi:hypothetical protein